MPKWHNNDLTKKDEPFVWKETQQEAFDKLKMLFTSAPVLAFPDNNCQFHLESDASEFATGAVLSMLKEDKWHPVTYTVTSKPLQCLTLTWCMKHTTNTHGNSTSLWWGQTKCKPLATN